MTNLYLKMMARLPILFLNDWVCISIIYENTLLKKLDVLKHFPNYTTSIQNIKIVFKNENL